MTRSTWRMLRRAPILAAVALPVVVMAGLTTERLTEGKQPSVLRVATGNRAYGDAAPPQALAITADFFEALEIDARAGKVEVATPAARPVERVAASRCPTAAPPRAPTTASRAPGHADGAVRVPARPPVAVADARSDSATGATLAGSRPAKRHARGSGGQAAGGAGPGSRRLTR